MTWSAIKRATVVLPPPLGPLISMVSTGISGSPYEKDLRTPIAPFGLPLKQMIFLPCLLLHWEVFFLFRRANRLNPRFLGPPTKGARRFRSFRGSTRSIRHRISRPRLGRFGTAWRPVADGVMKPGRAERWPVQSVGGCVETGKRRRVTKIRPPQGGMGVGRTVQVLCFFSGG